MAMLLPSPKSSNEKMVQFTSQNYITIKKDGNLECLFGNIGMVYNRVAARNKVLEPSSPQILKDLMLIKTGICNFY